MPDLGPQLMMTTGLISSPQVGTTGLTVADAAGVTRVQLGQIGTTFGQNYGLKVVGPGGSTTIIDGSSDMFRISATGTITNAMAAGGTNETTVTLTGLGAVPSAPAHLSLVHAAPDASTTAQQIGLYRGRVRWFVAATSGGAVTQEALVTFVDSRIRTWLDGSSQVVVGHGGDVNAGGAAATLYGRYYILSQTAL